MPRYLPAGHKYRVEPGIVLERPALAVRIAKIAADWAQVEERLMHTYAILLGWEHAEEGEPWRVPAYHDAADQIFEYISAFAQRMNLIGGLAQILLAKDEYENWSTIRDTLSRGQKARNRIVHAVWGICDDYPDALIRVPISGGREIYEAPEFKVEEDYVTNSTKIALDFFHTVCRRRASTILERSANGG
jgi:hypothetical protein